MPHFGIAATWGLRMINASRSFLAKRGGGIELGEYAFEDAVTGQVAMAVLTGFLLHQGQLPRRQSKRRNKRPTSQLGQNENGHLMRAHFKRSKLFVARFARTTREDRGGDPSRNGTGVILKRVGRG